MQPKLLKLPQDFAVCMYIERRACLNGKLFCAVSVHAMAAYMQSQLYHRDQIEGMYRPDIVNQTDVIFAILTIGVWTKGEAASFIFLDTGNAEKVVIAADGCLIVQSKTDAAAGNLKQTYNCIEQVAQLSQSKTIQIMLHTGIVGTSTGGCIKADAAADGKGPRDFCTVLSHTGDPAKISPNGIFHRQKTGYICSGSFVKAKGPGQVISGTGGKIGNAGMQAVSDTVDDLVDGAVSSKHSKLMQLPVVVWGSDGRNIRNGFFVAMGKISIVSELQVIQLCLQLQPLLHAVTGLGTRVNDKMYHWRLQGVFSFRVA